MNPLNLLSGVWGYVAAFVFGVILATGCTYYIVHTANAVTISNLKLEQSQAQTRDVTASLSKLTGFIDTMHAAASGYQTTLDQINANFAGIKQGLSNAIAKTPLPPDCKPDLGRLRSLTAAVGAANNATAP